MGLDFDWSGFQLLLQYFYNVVPGYVWTFFAILLGFRFWSLAIRMIGDHDV